jgi:succinoglycan biosynthesis transport protein ExoP
MQSTDVLTMLWRRRLLVLLVVLGAVVFSAISAFTRPARYEATATIALTPDVTRGQGFVASDNLTALLGTYAETAKAKVNLQRASAILKKPLPGDVDTDTEAGTGILRIMGRSTSRQGAVDTARAAAEAFQTSIEDNRLLVAVLIDPAALPEKPVQPRPPLIIGIAAVLGLLGGSLFAFAVDRLRRRVETTDDLAELTEAPVIGKLPRDRVGLQESYRALRTNIEFLTNRKTSVLQVTSADEAQGKSTVVANLGIALAKVGIETVIVDADLRRPQQHRIFELDNSEGLSTRMALPDSTFNPLPTSYPNLSVVPSGPIPPDSTEMLHVRFKSVLDGLRSEGTTILIDSPPLLPVSDARLIAPHMDGVILVVAAGTSKPLRVRSAIEKLGFAGAKLLGVVLNLSGEESDGGAGYSYYEYTEQPPSVTAKV